MLFLQDKVKVIMKKQVILQIYGQVQGVSFRYSTQRKAEELNLAGWVINEQDGSVKIVAVGAEKKLKELIEWCKGGEEGLVRVDKVEAVWSDTPEEFDNFSIKF